MLAIMCRPRIYRSAYENEEGVDVFGVVFHLTDIVRHEVSFDARPAGNGLAG